MSSGAPGPHKKARIEIIPLIDIMFFLLASFMLVSLSLVKLQGAKVDLPSAGQPPNNPNPQKPDPTTLHVDKDGNPAVGKERTPVAFKALAAWAARRLEEKGQDAKVYVSGDPGATYGAVITVFDRVRRGGLTKVTLAVKPPESNPAAVDPGAAPPSAP